VISFQGQTKAHQTGSPVLAVVDSSVTKIITSKYYASRYYTSNYETRRRLKYELRIGIRISESPAVFRFGLTIVFSIATL
jgi:hypothetical protein